MVFAVQCPNPKCRKYMLVEDAQRGQVVACLICKSGIKTEGNARPKKGDPKPGGGART